MEGMPVLVVPNLEDDENVEEALAERGSIATVKQVVQGVQPMLNVGQGLFNAFGEQAPRNFQVNFNNLDNLMVNGRPVFVVDPATNVARPAPLLGNIEAAKVGAQTQLLAAVSALTW